MDDLAAKEKGLHLVINIILLAFFRYVKLQLQTYRNAKGLKIPDEPSVDLSLSQMCDGDGYLDAITDGSLVVGNLFHLFDCCT